MRCEQACSEGLQLTQGVLATATTLGHNNEAVITAAILLALNDLMQRIMPKCFSRTKSAMLRGLLVRPRPEASVRRHLGIRCPARCNGVIEATGGARCSRPVCCQSQRALIALAVARASLGENTRVSVDQAATHQWAHATACPGLLWPASVASRRRGCQEAAMRRAAGRPCSPPESPSARCIAVLQAFSCLYAYRGPEP
jgi:hypothetical protein